MQRIVSVVGALSALVLLVAMSTTSAVRAQSPAPAPAPQLIATVSGQYEPLEIDNVEDQVLVGEVGKPGVLGASLDRKAGFVLESRFGTWDIVTKEPHSITSLYKGVVVIDESGLALHGRPGTGLIMSQQFGSIWSQMKSIRPLGGDRIAFLFGQDHFGIMRVFPDTREAPSIWFLGEEDSKAKMSALEVIESTLFVAIPEGVMAIDLVNDEPYFAGFVTGVDFSMLERVVHLEVVGEDKKYLLASDGVTKIWIINPDTLKVVWQTDDPDSFEQSVRANGRQVVMVGTHGVYVYELDKWSGQLTEIARLGGAENPDLHYLWADINRWGFLVTSHFSDGLQLWDLGRSAIFPGPTPTPALEPGQIKGVLYLPWMFQPTFRWDESMKPFAAPPAAHNGNLLLHRASWPGAPTTDHRSAR